MNRDVSSGLLICLMMALFAGQLYGNTIPQTDTIPHEFDISKTGSSLECGRGQRLSISNNGQGESCIPCQSNTYMPVRYHRKRYCLPCDQVLNPNVEIIVSDCTPSTNTVRGCAPTYYKSVTNARIVDSFTCMKCRNCSNQNPPSFIGRPCQGEDNTICCENPGMEVVEGRCIHSRHTVNICALGYFGIYSTDTLSKPVCLPCTDCSLLDTVMYEIRKCDHYTDSLCCPHSEMIAIRNLTTGIYQCQLHQTLVSSTTSEKNSPNSSGMQMQNVTCDKTDFKWIILLAVLASVFFLLSIILGGFLYKIKRKSWHTPGLSQSRRRRESLLGPNSQELEYISERE